MSLRPRPRGESVLTRSVIVTVSLVGLVITIGLLLLIELGKSKFDSVQIGQSIAFTAFALCSSSPPSSAAARPPPCSRSTRSTASR